MHIERHLIKPLKTNNVFILLWRWIREKYRQRFVYPKCLPTILLPNLRRVYPALEPKDLASEFKETDV